MRNILQGQLAGNDQPGPCSPPDPTDGGAGVSPAQTRSDSRKAIAAGVSAALARFKAENPLLADRLSGASGAGSPGLVSIRTSDTVERISLSDGHLRRLKRMKRGIKSFAEILQRSLTDGGFRFRAALITPTYRPGEAWSPGDVTALVKCYREWARRRGFALRYAWVMELQRTGRPHYHLILWLPRGVTPPMPDKQGWWKHGMTNCKWARSPVGYICKYASKGFESAVQGGLPKGARVYGTGGLDATSQAKWCWAMAPMWLRLMVPEGHLIRRKLRGWWLDVSAGIWYQSPWEWDGFGADGCGQIRWRGYSMDSIRFDAMDGPPYGPSAIVC
jgi:hypothetical protein